MPVKMSHTCDSVTKVLHCQLKCQRFFRDVAAHGFTTTQVFHHQVKAIVCRHAFDKADDIWVCTEAPEHIHFRLNLLLQITWSGEGLPEKSFHGLHHSRDESVLDTFGYFIYGESF